MKKWFAFLVLIAFSLLFAESANVPKEKGIDWIEVFIGWTFLIGLFLMFPITVYTWLKEDIDDGSDHDPKPEPISENVADRNLKSIEILERIENMLTPFESEEGEQKITITNGKQARFVKKGLDFINLKLQPTDEEIIKRVQEFTDVYENRTERHFAGSKWVIIFAVGFLVFMFYNGSGVKILLNSIFWVQIVGIIFYYLASKAPIYGIEKRMKLFGGYGGNISRVFGALFLGQSTKYYVKKGHGPWERDYQTEGEMGLIWIAAIAFAALMIGALITVFAVFNFVINYSTSYLRPFDKLENWYEKNFTTPSVLIPEEAQV
ncbi:MAG: hypothetical protein JXR48_10580 [Candidatus Delongbacteria bacterium]|nr:hypothetical protein [Candidatus Delongbacteria bacterium]MBN2835397.1 hypothetical protein [Candidatus Delongbacteria bacterium]